MAQGSESPSAELLFLDLEWQHLKAMQRYETLSALVLRMITDLLNNEPLSLKARVRLSEIAETLTKIKDKEFDG